MTWTYDQATGHLIDPTGAQVAVGYAGGNCGNDPDGVNNPDMQGEKQIGPLPVGIYTLGTVVPQSHLGPFAIPLIPDADNDMLGRGGFYIHGDTAAMNKSASEGCMIFSRAVREQVYGSDDHTITVVRGGE